MFLVFFVFFLKNWGAAELKLLFSSHERTWLFGADYICYDIGFSWILSDDIILISIENLKQRIIILVCCIFSFFVFVKKNTTLQKEQMHFMNSEKETRWTDKQRIDNRIIHTYYHVY